jgi:phosphopantetheinyl transferase
LSPALFNEFLLLKHNARRREWIATRWMILKQLTELSVDAFERGDQRLHLEKRANGQLFLPLAPGWGVSVSHCPGFAAVLLAPGRVGVDVERYRPQVLRLANRYLQAAEQSILGNDIGGLILGWAIKEAVFKWMGGGGIAFRKEIQIESLHPGQALAQVRVQRKGTHDSECIGVHYQQQPALERVCAWVVEER